ncbi:nuclear transport factor 2 family protein [Solihabitans fulvus]|uniref:Nuclear transport factor 2 family protein n=1 Tax=Solihabitans fulvus TaxID=1892852 RepID=A0A5B2XJY0_9PSEU|nr:nuclear transport factor 2 family protein [Solihabitans fulvus]KAA2263703.1 nuclear transport factor 2 family protein [Solihabitans fulvus]
MDAAELTNPAVRSVVTAMERQDRDAFYAAFDEDAKLTDDGNAQPFRTWAEREVFSSHGRLAVEREAEDGLYLTGEYRSDLWNMPTFWRFMVEDGKVARLDVGAM